MAIITSSTVIEDRVQKDGRRAIREKHIDQIGAVYFFDWIALAGDDSSSQLAGHATQLGTDLVNNELAANLQSAYAQGSLTTNYCTVAQIRAFLRLAFQTATSWDVVRLGNFINGLGLSDAQLESVFGVTAGAQLTALKTRLTNLASHYATVIADQGQ